MSGQSEKEKVLGVMQDEKTQPAIAGLEDGRGHNPGDPGNL